MKKDQNLPTKMYTATTVQENHFRTIQVIQEINPHITQVIEEDHQNEEIHKTHHKITTIDQIVEITTPDQIQTHNDLFLDLIPNQEITTIQTTNHEIHHTIGIETTPIIEIEGYSNNRNQNYPNNRSRNNSYNRSNYNRPNNNYQTDREIIHKIDTQVIIIVIEIIPNHHTGIIITYNNSNNRHRSSTPKHQRQINQVQANPETTSDPQVLMTQ